MNSDISIVKLIINSYFGLEPLKIFISPDPAYLNLILEIIFFSLMILGLIKLSEALLSKNLKVHNNRKEFILYIPSYLLIIFFLYALSVSGLLTMLAFIFVSITLLTLTIWFTKKIIIKKSTLSLYNKLIICFIFCFFLLTFKDGSGYCLTGLTLKGAQNLTKFNVPSNFPGSICGKIYTTYPLLIRGYFQLLLIYYLLPAFWIIAFANLIKTIFKNFKLK